MQNAPLATGIIFGTLFSVIAGMVYLILLHGPGPVFYPFAALAFLGGPLIAGTTGAIQSSGKNSPEKISKNFAREKSQKIFLFSFTRASVPIPARAGSPGGRSRPSRTG